MSCGKKTRHTARIGCCPTCHELFSGDTAFQAHRRAFQCTPPADVGLVARPSKSAPDEVVWGNPAGNNPWSQSVESWLHERADCLAQQGHEREDQR